MEQASTDRLMGILRSRYEELELARIRMNAYMLTGEFARLPSGQKEEMIMRLTQITAELARVDREIDDLQEEDFAYMEDDAMEREEAEEEADSD